MMADQPKREQDDEQTALLDFARELNPTRGGLGVDVPFTLTPETPATTVEQLPLFTDEDS